MIVILNPSAGGGTALEKWARIKDSLPFREEQTVIQSVGDRPSLPQIIEQAVKNGEPHIVAAGGDGTVHEVLNALLPLSITQEQDVILGAIGLGSSNDFHKPHGDAQSYRGIPMRIDFRHARKRDIGLVNVEGNNGVVRRYFLINASIGLTAEGNAFFNTPDCLLRWLKKRSAGVGILYAALRSIATYQNVDVGITFGEGEEEHVRVTNLGIVKNPYFSGSLHYDVVPDYTNGKLGIFAAANLGLFGRLNLLRHLCRGKFSGTPHTFSRSETEVTIEAEHSLTIEVDGEILTGRRAQFSVLQNSLRVCP